MIGNYDPEPDRQAKIQELMLLYEVVGDGIAKEDADLGAKESVNDKVSAYFE